MKKDEHCLIDTCKNNKIYARGVCKNHYNWMSVLAHNKVRKWKEFEAVGMALPRTHGRAERENEILMLLLKKQIKKSQREITPPRV